MTRHLIRLLGVLAGLATAATLAAPAAGVLTFEQALQRALERSPAIVTAGGGRDVAAAQLRRARAWENPTLDIETENVLGEGALGGFDAAETTVSLSQPLPLGGGRAAAVRGARAGESLAAVGAELALIEVRRELTIAYAEAVAADRLAAIERDRARIGAQTRAAVEQRFAAGLESELQRARVEVESIGLQATARRAAAESMHRRRALAALWRDETVAEALDETWFDALGTSGGPEPQVASHPRQRSADLEIERTRARFDEARGRRFAGVEARLGTRRLQDRPADSDQAFVIGLAMPLPLWDRNAAGIAEARAALTAAEMAAERIGRELEGERAQAVAGLEAARLEAAALERSGLPAAASAARLAQQGYDAGRLSLLERLDAERALAQVREHLELARREAHRSRAVLESLRPAGLQDLLPAALPSTAEQ